MGEAEGALEQEENKVLRAQLELTQVRQEIERRISEKEEFIGMKKTMSKAIDSMQSAFEADVAELEMSLEHANSTNLETQKSIKKYQTQIRDCQAKLEDEQRSKEVAREQLLVG